MTKEEEQRILKENQVAMIGIDADSSDELLTVSQYAYLHGVHKHTVLNWIKAGKVRFFIRSHGVYARYYIPTDTVPPMVRPEKIA